MEMKMITTIKGRDFDIGTTCVDPKIIEKCMEIDYPPVDTIVYVNDSSRFVVTSTNTVRAESINEKGAVVSARDITMSTDQMLKIRDLWAINSARKGVRVG